MLNTARLDAVLDEIAARWELPGLALGLVEDRRVIHARYLGVQNLATGAPVTPQTVFCVTSVSKTFTAALVMRLAERGALGLDDALLRHLPDLRMGDPRAADITLRHVLSHTSGLPDMDEHVYNDLVSNPERDAGAAGRYLRRLDGDSLLCAPGAEFHYSNIAYNLLGLAAARAAGMDFESAARELVLRPAGMADSTFLPEEVPPERLAFPHLRMPELAPSPFYPYHRADAPASFLHATLAEMCRWASCHLEQDLLAAHSYAALWSPAAAWGVPPPSMYEDMGLGWTLGHYAGARTLSHGGMGFGWSDFLLLLPEQRRAAIVLGIEESPARGHIVRAAADTLLGRDPQPGGLSWMIPVSRALAQGGLRSALEAQFPGCDDDPDELISLAFQCSMAGRPQSALDALQVNARRFPEHAGTPLEMARLHLRLGQPARAVECLRQALALEADLPAARRLLQTLGVAL